MGWEWVAEGPRKNKTKPTKLGFSKSIFITKIILAAFPFASNWEDCFIHTGIQQQPSPSACPSPLLSCTEASSSADGT